MNTILIKPDKIFIALINSFLILSLLSFVANITSVTIIMIMSIDEVATLHERADTLLKYIPINFSSTLGYRWVILGILFVAIFSITFFSFWMNLPRRTKYLFFLSGLIFVGGAIVSEMIAGLSGRYYGEYSLIYNIITAVE